MMQQLIKNTKSILIALLISFTFSLNCQAIEDAIIAIVNDELLTLKDLKNYIIATQASLVAEGVDELKIQAIMKDLQSNGLNKLIEDKLILSRAKNIGLEVQNKLIDKRIEDLKAKYDSEEEFFHSLINNGTNITELRQKFIDQFKIQFIVEHEVKSAIYVKPQEVTDFYDNNKNLFQKKERVNLQSIYVAFSDNKTNSKEKANEALQLVKAGEDFLTVAKQYSDSPSLGEVERGQLMPEIEETVFNLKEGEFSSLVEVETGIYIFKLTGKTSQATARLMEVKEKIYNFIYQKKLNDKFLSWINELKKDAYIEIKN